MYLSSMNRQTQWFTESKYSTITVRQIPRAAICRPQLIA